MSKTTQKTACFYLPHEDVRRLDELRGIISRSKMGAIAVRRLIADVESGELVLLSEIMTTTTTTESDENSGVRGPNHQAPSDTYTDSVTPTSIGVTKTTGRSEFS